MCFINLEILIYRMKRLTKRLLIEANHEAELMIGHFLKNRPGEIVRLAGPNYTYFTNGKIMKVFFEGVNVREVKKYLSGIIFPITKLEVGYLRNILKDLKAIKSLYENTKTL